MSSGQGTAAGRADPPRHAGEITIETVQLEHQDDVAYTGVADVDVGDDGLLHLFTRSPSAVVTYRASGEYVGSWGVGDFRQPHGLTFADGMLHVVDQFAHDVRIFSTDGREITVLGRTNEPSATGFDWNQPTFKEKYLTIARGAPPFNNPTKLVMAADGSSYVSDGYGNARVHHFGPDRRLLASWGEPGSGPGEFRLPHGLCVTADGSVLVADRENDRIQRFDRDGSFIDCWNDVQRPASIVPLEDDRFLVAELAWPAGAYSFRHGPIEHDIRPRLSVMDGAGRVLARRPLDLGDAGGARDIQPHGLSTYRAGFVYIANLAASSSDPMLRVSFNS